MGRQLEDHIETNDDSTEQASITWEPIPLILELPLPPQNKYLNTTKNQPKSFVIEIDMN